MFAVECDGREVTTIEGLAADRAADALREAFVEHGAVQCGFCTPGMMMQAEPPARSTHPRADEDSIKRGIEGNLCRCTGYEKIVDAIVAAARAAQRQHGEPQNGDERNHAKTRSSATR